MTGYVPRPDALLTFGLNLSMPRLTRWTQSGHSDDALSRNGHIGCCPTSPQQL